MNGHYCTVGLKHLMQLRKIRVHHWIKCLSNRNKANLARNPVTIKKYHEIANEHLTNVQTLNVFFPEPFDTAENDLAKGIK